MKELKAAHVERENIQLVFQNGFAKTELLPGTYAGGVRVYRCVLKADHCVHPEIEADTLQVLCLTEGRGAITTPSKCFAVNDVSVFVPDVEASYAIHAATDMTYTMFVVEQKEGDKKRYEDFHMAVPFYKTIDQCTEYVQKSCKTENSKSFSVIPTKRFCRILMGGCLMWGDKQGTFETGHPAVAQWNVPFGESTKFVVNAEGDLFEQKNGDFSYLPAGIDHDLYTEGDNTAGYFWFEHYVQEKDYLISYPRTRE